MENFGSKFTAFTAIAGSKNEPTNENTFFLTKKQWALVIAGGILVAILINFWLVRAGL